MKWIPIDNYHQKPKDGVLYSIIDGKRILHDMCLINGSWYHVDSDKPTEIEPTYYLEIKLP